MDRLNDSAPPSFGGRAMTKRASGSFAYLPDLPTALKNCPIPVRFSRPSRSASSELNNLVEQDHRRVKQRVYAMLGFKRFGNAAVTISGIELVNKIRKGEFDASRLR